MHDRSRPPVVVSSTRIGRTDLGEGSAVIEDEALVVVVRGVTEERPFRVALAAIDDVGLEAKQLTIVLRDGTRLVLESASAADLRDDLAVQCRAIPELTRALRAFGSRRGQGSARASGPSEQQRFFAPLLDARRQAVAATSPAVAMAAFDGARLGEALVVALQSFASERHGDNGPARRALEAELVDLVEPLQAALESLKLAAADSDRAMEDLRVWRAWAAELRTTFEVADRVWLALDVALDAAPWHA
jgi:hypothetical protein